LGLVAEELGDEETSLQHLEDALQLATELEHGSLVAHVQTSMAESLRAAGKFQEAESLYEQALAFGRQTNRQHGLPVFLCNLAMLSIQQSDMPRARDRLLEALAGSASRYGLAWGQSVLQTCAGYLAAMKDWSRAARLYGASETLREQEGTTNNRADEQFIAPLVAQVREGLGEADYQSTYAQGRQLSLDRAVTEAQTWLSAED
jgi:tetratricopeptide (TPR) repeat protein